MTNYKPYSPEWSRKRYLEEAIQTYFNSEASLDTILDDIVDTLQNNIDYHKTRAEKFQEVLDGLKSLSY
jgi:cell fate (sporulation/competence/biofilm development) regulator YlbF (YheA/YmcA/DUF963 family)